MTAQAHVDHNRDIVERLFSDVLNGHDPDRLSDYYTDDCRIYGMTGPGAIDRDEYAAFLATQFAAFPDLSFEIDEIITEDTRIAVRWTAHGTHEGTLVDIPATGKAATVTGISLIHLEGDKAVEVHSNQDMLGLLQQLDAIPDSPRKIVRLLAGQMKSRIANR